MTPAGFEAKLDAHRRAGGCDCQDHLRLVGLTPPRKQLSQFPLSKAYPVGQGPRQSDKAAEAA